MCDHLLTMNDGQRLAQRPIAVYMQHDGSTSHD